MYKETEARGNIIFCEFECWPFFFLFLSFARKLFDRVAENVSIFKTKSLFPQQMLFPLISATLPHSRML